jgi:hypothetical protein
MGKDLSREIALEAARDPRLRLSFGGTTADIWSIVGWWRGPSRKAIQDGRRAVVMLQSWRSMQSAKKRLRRSFAVVKAAHEGDMRAADILLRRCWPERKGRPITLTLPPVRDAAVLDATAAIVSATVRGEVTPTKHNPSPPSSRLLAGRSEPPISPSGSTASRPSSRRAARDAEKPDQGYRGRTRHGK